MSLRGNPVSEPATLPDGRSIRIELRVLDDDYIRDRSRTVTLELRSGEEVLASLATVLEPEQTSEARRFAHELRRRLEDGSLEPTAGAIEPLADTAG
ncbi:MAG: hypothetical protein ACRDNB_05750 [Gaiellaceae bacterium]